MRGDTPAVISRGDPDAAVIEWLLEPENPTVRYLTMTDLLGLPGNHHEVGESRAAIMKTGAVPPILARHD